MQTILEVLKIAVALFVLVGIGRYYVIHGLPPRGRGRWRGVLDELSGRRERRK